MLKCHKNLKNGIFIIVRQPRYSEKKDFEKELERGEDFRDKIQKRRIFAGAKGVGRFSCDKLGSVLKLYTKKKDGDKIHFLNFEWGKFELDQKKEFQHIPVYYSEVKKLDIQGYENALVKSGTILEISSLNDETGTDVWQPLKFWFNFHHTNVLIISL